MYRPTNSRTLSVYSCWFSWYETAWVAPGTIKVPLVPVSLHKAGVPSMSGRMYPYLRE